VVYHARPELSVRVAFISPSGRGNLGDAAIISSLIAGVQRRHPAAEIVGFTLNPEGTTREHGVPAFRLNGFKVSSYVPAPPGDAFPGATALARFGPLRRPVRWASVVAGDRAFRRDALARVRGFDLVVVSGGGQLDAFFGGPLGQPYTLWSWSGLARRAGARFAILSVGTGRLSTPLSRLLIRRTLAAASYRSFRDHRSVELLAGMTPPDDPVVPDLAYAVPVEAPGPRTSTRPATVGVSPMAFADPRSWPEEDAARYARHVDGVAALVTRLARAGHPVVLFTTDTPDRLAVDDLLARVRGTLDAGAQARIRVAETTSLSALFGVLREVDIVVSARLHGVMLSHILGLPVLAISHERKVATLMADMDHSDLCIPIDAFDPEAGWQRFTDLAARRDQLAADVRTKVGVFRERVEAQYDRIFGGQPFGGQPLGGQPLGGQPLGGQP
jgi:polysaccharide pyruvyl transferase WcaK-like protein